MGKVLLCGCGCALGLSLVPRRFWGCSWCGWHQRRAAHLRHRAGAADTAEIYTLIFVR